MDRAIHALQVLVMNLLLVVHILMPLLHTVVLSFEYKYPLHIPHFIYFSIEVHIVLFV